MTGMEETAARTEYVVIDGGTVTLAGTVYTVEIQDYLATGGHMTWLTGPRGGVYFLRKFTGADDGLRQVISWKTGVPLRRKDFSEVRVYELGDVIEEVQR